MINLVYLSANDMGYLANQRMLNLSIFSQGGYFNKLHLSIGTSSMHLKRQGAGM